MKIWVRFVLYASSGLLFFCAYFALVLPAILHTLMPGGPWQTMLVVQGSHDLSATLVFIAAFLFCFLSAGALFSLFLVIPVSQLIASIQRIDAKDHQAKSPGPAQGKMARFLFHEVFSSVENLRQRLTLAEQERAATEAAKQTWLAGVSHDLKTPLSYITGYASLLLTPTHDFDQAELQRHLATIYAKGQQMGELIDDLNLSFMLDSGTPLPLSREQADPANLIRDIVETFTSDNRWAAYHFVVVDPARVLSVWLDRKLMSRVIANLIQNGVEHNPPGTTLHLSCGECPDGNLFIAIDDDGSGMDSTTLAKCLTKHFSSSQHSRPGKGLGLFIVKSILDAHEAALTIDSKQGQGTRVRIVFGQGAQQR